MARSLLGTHTPSTLSARPAASTVVLSDAALQQRLRQKRSSAYIEAVYQLDTGGHTHSPADTQALIDEMVELSDGFAGSDLESAVREAVKEAYLRGDEVVTSDLFRRSLVNVVPLSKTAPEQIENIRAWGRDWAVPASGQAIDSSALPTRSRRQVLA